MKTLKRDSCNNCSKQTGFSLVELMIASALGITVFAGIVGLLSASEQTSKDTVQIGELQESGTYALNTISQDIMMSGYMGYMTNWDTGTDMTNVSMNNATVPIDCVGEGGNNGTFPAINSELTFRTLWISEVEGTDEMGCITSASIGSSMLQIKRGMGFSVANELNSRYYLQSNVTEIMIYAGSDSAAMPEMESADLYEYQHHIYYIRKEVRGTSSSGTYSVPILSRMYLHKKDTATAAEGLMSSEDLVEGIEDVQYLVGIDDDGDNIVDYYLPAKDVSRDIWDGINADVIAVKVYILVRSIFPDANVDNQFSYDLGTKIYTPKDNYRRMLFTNTVSILNFGEQEWQEQ